MKDSDARTADIKTKEHSKDWATAGEDTNQASNGGAEYEACSQLV
jgi:hypothetical protein